MHVLPSWNVQELPWLCRMHLLRGGFIQHIRGGGVCGGVRGVPGGFQLRRREREYRAVLLR